MQLNFGSVGDRPEWLEFLITLGIPTLRGRVWQRLAGWDESENTQLTEDYRKLITKVTSCSEARELVIHKML